ncbi:MAG TPA: hypothetical protein VJT15_03505 [Pyrinomonadaceae bacterium]|nr:hypothetical protein [Pyrinomonadaceae bacterium]
MKRCPQCEFIYEDDQSLCDMDGVVLVLDSRTLPNLHSLATVPDVPGKAAAARRNRMVPAFATILLTLVIASFYYFGTPRNGAPANNFSPPNVTVPPAPTPELPQAQPPAVAEEPKPAEPAKPTAPARKTTTKPAAVKPANPVKPAEPKKDDSKVGSILKKTGKILKKPFRF